MDAHAAVLHLEDLPSCAQDDVETLRLINDDGVTLADLAVVINGNPTLAATILGVANSAYFGRSGEVQTIHDAIVRVLGMQMVRALSVSMLITGGLNTDLCPPFDLRRYWRRSLVAARCAQLLARANPNLDPDAAYLCGLLADVGMPVLVHLRPTEMQTAIALHEVSNCETSLQSITQETAGISYREAGALIAERWHLPADISNSCRRVGGEWAPLVCRLTAVADRWAGSLERQTVDPFHLDRTRARVKRELGDHGWAPVGVDAALSETQSCFADLDDLASTLAGRAAPH